MAERCLGAGQWRWWLGWRVVVVAAGAENGGNRCKTRLVGPVFYIQFVVDLIRVVRGRSGYRSGARRILLCCCGLGHWVHPQLSFPVDLNHQAYGLHCSVVLCRLGLCPHVFRVCFTFGLAQPRVFVAQVWIRHTLSALYVPYKPSKPLSLFLPPFFLCHFFIALLGFGVECCGAQVSEPQRWHACGFPTWCLCRLLFLPSSSSSSSRCLFFPVSPFQ